MACTHPLLFWLAPWPLQALFAFIRVKLRNSPKRENPSSLPACSSCLVFWQGLLGSVPSFAEDDLKGRDVLAAWPRELCFQWLRWFFQPMHSGRVSASGNEVCLLGLRGLGQARAPGSH